MLHHNKNRKFGRESGQRRALLKGLASSLVLEERIKTTEAKAKALRPFVERLITEGKKGTVASRRLLTTRIGSPVAAQKISDTLSVKYKDRQGGYTRILKLAPRIRDAAQMAYIELV